MMGRLTPSPIIGRPVTRHRRPPPSNRRTDVKHRVETIGQATLSLGDAREVMPEIADYDAVITSPPYGGIRDMACRRLEAESRQPLLGEMFGV